MFQNVGTVAFVPTLNGINRLMERLGKPRIASKIIHVAGTNGKGSVSNMLSSVLMETGYKVGCYTSPHLLDYRERVRINGEMVSTDIVSDFVDIVSDIIDNNSPSFFEITTALAFYAFTREEVDIAVVEVGLGGETDSTNIVNPTLSVITNIAFDHKNLLGDTLGAIARQKGGIIKDSVPVVIGEHLTESDEVFEEIASSKSAPLVYAQDIYSVTYSSGDNSEIEVNSEPIRYKLSLRGDCQKRNIVTLLAVISQLRALSIDIPQSAVMLGIERVSINMSFTGRWQVMQSSPLVVCDTGHNRAGIEYIVEQLKRSEYRKLYIVMGFMADKEVEDILTLLPSNAYYLCVTASNPRSMSGLQLLEQAVARGFEGESFATVSEGYERALSLAGSDDMIFIGGSTFIVADFLGRISKTIF